MIDQVGIEPGNNSIICQTITAGVGRSKIWLSWYQCGQDLIVFIFNSSPHVGSVALAGIDTETKQSWASVLCSPGHREDALAHELALRVAGHLKRRTCLIAGIHIEDATVDEIEAVIEVSRELANLFLQGFKPVDL